MYHAHVYTTATLKQYIINQSMNQYYFFVYIHGKYFHSKVSHGTTRQEWDEAMQRETKRTATSSLFSPVVGHTSAPLIYYRRE